MEQDTFINWCGHLSLCSERIKGHGSQDDDVSFLHDRLLDGRRCFSLSQKYVMSHKKDDEKCELCDESLTREGCLEEQL